MPLSNTQYESIIKGYERTRDRNRHIHTERREEVYRLIPEYAKLDASVGSLCVEQGRQMLEGNENALKELHSTLARVARQKSRMLREAGLPEDYLEPIYDCPDCRDTGYITSEAGKQKCHCFLQQEISLLYEQSNIREALSRENFSALSYEYYQGEDLERFQKAVKICRDFVQNFNQDYHNLFFYGTVGTGKSFLSGCIAEKLLRQGFSVIYFSSTALFDTLARYAFDSRSKESLYDFYKDLYHCDLVIIDDLGTEITNAFVTSQLFSCLNERHIARKATIISTNLTLEELRDHYSDRIFSRITSYYELCKLTGPDIRMYKKRAANTSNM